VTKHERSRIVVTISVIVFLFLVYFVHTSGADIVIDELKTRTSKTIIVNAMGDGDYTCIQWAIDNSTNGDTILIESGVYLEQLNINKSISLVGTVDGCIIEGKQRGVAITVSSDGVGIMGLTINGNELAFMISGIAQNCSIGGNNITNNSRGIEVFGSNNSIENNVFHRNSMLGIRIWGSDNTISNNTIQNIPTGIEVHGLKNQIANNIMKIGQWGIHLDSSDSNVITNNVCTNYLDGIYLYDSDMNFISNNECNFNTGNGIHLENSKKNKVSLNTCNSNDLYGIFIIDQDDQGNLDSKGAGNELSGNKFKSNGEGDIYYESVGYEEWMMEIIIIIVIIIIVGSLVFQLLFKKKRNS